MDGFGDDGMCEEYGLKDANDVVMECDCSGVEVTSVTEDADEDCGESFGFAPGGEGARVRPKCLPEASEETNDDERGSSSAPRVLPEIDPVVNV